MENILKFLEKIKKIEPILREIIKNGGRPYLVGGTVRDLVLGREIKDIDIEVHAITLEELEKCLKKFGGVKLVGKKFGILRLYGYDIDWSLPRKDTKGRKPKVEIDPNMTIEDALRRRDLTMNAMAIDLSKVSLMSFDNLRMSDDDKNFENGIKIFSFDSNESLNKSFSSKHTLKEKGAHGELGEPYERQQMPFSPIIDPYGGLEDIKNKRLRAVDEKLFLDDPLRFFRVMQFIGRFQFYPDDALTQLCKKMDLYDVVAGRPLARERIFEEIKKLFLKSKRPSLGIRWLDDIGRLKEIFPEIYMLKDVPQRKDYHPEGDVFEHTMQCLDAAAQLDKYENDEEKFLIMLGILCHDLGKPVTTDEQLSAHGHSQAGVPFAKKLLKRITNDKFLIDAVCKLVLYHTRPLRLVKEKSSLKAYKRLALKLAPQISLRQVALVNLCDVRGRNPKGHEPLKNIYGDEYQEFLSKAKEARVEHGPEKPVLLGRHLLDVMQPGPQMGELLKKAYQIQIEEGVKDVEELKRRVLGKK